MEKLQAALQNARKSRGEVTREAAPLAPARAAGVKKTDDLWAALTPFELEDSHLEAHRIVTRKASPSAAPFDVLRTKILLQMRQNGWKRLAITSPMPKSGKTTIACNLALGLGRQRDLRTILLDLDLRDSSIKDFFKASPEHGIQEVLTGQIGFADQAVRIGDNVACSMAIQSESDPTRMLLAEQTAEVINRIEAAYQPDVMIFDLSSVLVNDETRAFLKNADCALIVVRAESTRFAQFDTCEREIGEHTNVLGVVLNAYTHDS